MASSSSYLSPTYLSSIPLASPMSYDPHTNELNGNGNSTSFPFASVFLASVETTKVEVGEDLFLGLDLSTQALKATFINENLSTVAEYSLNFDKDLPHYLTTSGVHIGKSNGVVTSPVLMWLEALDSLFSRISSTEKGKVFLGRTKSISGAAQQHATVYWSLQATSILSSLSHDKTLVEQLVPAFATLDSPNWQDSSTSIECQEMEAALGTKGKEEMSRRTGSCCHERFSGPQIMKIRKNTPELYAATDRISLASSFLTTILIGTTIQSIEESDACGMNLWNLESGIDWDSDLLAIVSGGTGVPSNELRRKLGTIIKDGGVSSGFISSYLVGRYGFSSECRISSCTGDNPATLLSFSLLSSDVVVSLGTSDTILLSTVDYVPNVESHTFSYPANMLQEGKIDSQGGKGKRSFMGMLCYKNGSLPREYVCDTYAKGDWDEFNRLVEKYPLVAGNREKREIGFYFLKPEIIPHNGTGIHRFNAVGEEIDEFSNPELNPSAILISQFLSFKLRSSPMLASNNGIPNRIFAVGGASTNLTILQLLSNILSAPIHLSFSSTSSSVNSCSLGAALKAYWTYYRTIEGNEKVNFEDCVSIARSKSEREGEVEKVIMPDLSLREEVEKLLVRFRELEGRCCV